MELRLEYFWITFVVGFALLGLALICRAVSGQDRRTKKQKHKKGQQPHDVGDEASIASENSQANDLDSTNTALSKWFRRSIATPQASATLPISYSRTSAAMDAVASSRQDSAAQTSSQGRINQCATTRSPAVTPRISPDNPLHSQRGLHRSKFTFDETPSPSVLVLADNCAAPEIIRSISWEQSIRRWTSVIFASNTEAPDQTETSV